MVVDGGTGPQEQPRRSRLDEYAEMAVSGGTGDQPPPGDALPPPPGTTPQAPSEPQARATAPASDAMDRLDRDRRDFPALLGEFRRTPVLVPLALADGDEAPLAADFGGIRWIYAFSDESALARFAIAICEGGTHACPRGQY
ncbi:hypothetical protein ACIBBD_13905 [Streptomyces sp. NPDC051315]|uniref:hypothetical protein n=1 Tax=Streptomyces sp. NPDC051315 TaxID=3365650 RepID=UPI0037905492